MESQKNSLPYQLEEANRKSRSENLPIADVTVPGLMKNGVIEESHSGYVTSPLTFTEDGRVTYAIERPKFQRLVHLLRSGEYKGVICLCWDRISRNEQDGLVIKALMDSGVDFRFVQVTYDRSSSGALHRDIDGMFSQHYSRVISEKVRNTFEKFRRDGRCLGRAPLGYLDSGSDNKPFDAARAQIVARCFEKAATAQTSYAQLAHWANAQGLTTKPQKIQRRRDDERHDGPDDRPKVCRPITAKSLENMLTNPFYIGMHRERDGSVRECNHAPLIDRAVFYRVRAMIRSRTQSVRYDDVAFFPYRNRVLCGECRREFIPYVKKGHTYYRVRCRTGCSNATPNLRVGDIDVAVAGFFGQIHFSDAELAQIETGAGAALSRIAEHRNAELEDLERQRKRIYADLDYLKSNKIALLRSGAWSVDSYGADVARLEAELDDVHSKMDVFKEAEHEMLQYVLSFSKLVQRAAVYYEYALDSEKQKLIDLAITELTFFNGKFSCTPKGAFQALFSRHDVEHDEKQVEIGKYGVANGN